MLGRSLIDAMPDMKSRSVLSRLPLVVVGFAILVLCLAVAFAHGLISPRGLGLILVGFVLLLTVTVRNLMGKVFNQSQFEQQKNTERRLPESKLTRRLRSTLVALPIILVLGLWLTRGGPAIPRITGAGIDIFLFCWVLYIFRQSKR